MLIQHGVSGRGRYHSTEVKHGRNVIDLTYNYGTRSRLSFTSDEEKLQFALKVLGQLPALFVHEHEEMRKMNAMTGALAENKTVREALGEL